MVLTRYENANVQKKEKDQRQQISKPLHILTETEKGKKKDNDEKTVHNQSRKRKKQVQSISKRQKFRKIIMRVIRKAKNTAKTIQFRGETKSKQREKYTG